MGLKVNQLLLKTVTWQPIARHSTLQAEPGDRVAVDHNSGCINLKHTQNDRNYSHIFRVGCPLLIELLTIFKLPY